MSSLVRFTSPRLAEVIEEDLAPLGPDQVRIATLYSGISAGTELTAYRGSNPYLNKKWDEDRRLFVDGSTSFSYPVDGWGTRRSARSSAAASTTPTTTSTPAQASGRRSSTRSPTPEHCSPEPARPP